MKKTKRIKKEKSRYVRSAMVTDNYSSLYLPLSARLLIFGEDKN
jgi:hypothetical protein